MDLKETRKKVKTEADKYGIDFHQSEMCLLPSFIPPMAGFSDDWEPVNFSGIHPGQLH